MQTLTAAKREDRNRSAIRKLRQEGGIPAIVYGKNIESTPIAVKELDLLMLLRNEGKNAVFKLNYGQKPTTVMIGEVQSDPIRDNVILHVDFFEVDMAAETTVEVSLETIGEAPGEKEGGVVQQPYQTIEVKCLPADIPEKIEVDISQLNIGDSLTISDLSVGDDIEILTEEEAVVVSVLPPAQEEPETPADQEQTEPELVAADDGKEEEQADQEEENDQ